MTQPEKLSNYINGAWRESGAERYLDVHNPATGQVLARVPPPPGGAEPPLPVVVVISGILTAAFYAYNKRALERQARAQTLGEISAIHQSFRHHFQQDIVRNLGLLASNPKLNDYLSSSAVEKDIIRQSVERLCAKMEEMCRGAGQKDEA